MLPSGFQRSLDPRREEGAGVVVDRVARRARAHEAAHDALLPGTGDRAGEGDPQVGRVAAADLEPGLDGALAGQAAAPADDERDEHREHRREPPGPHGSSTGVSGRGDPCSVSPARCGTVSRKRDPYTALAPRLEPAVVQPGVLERDRQAQARAPGRARPRGVRAPEAGEDVGGLPRPQADAVVLDDDGDGIRPDGDVDVDRPALAVLDGVDDEVAQDALDPALVDLGLGGSVGGVHGDDAPPALGERPRRLDDLGDGAARSTGSMSSAAAPASKRLISSRSASRSSNRSSSPASSSADRATVGSKPVRDSWMRSTAIRIVVSGVRSSWETSETKRCCTADRPSSWRIWLCRLSAMPLNDVARRARSSSPRVGIRSLSLPADRRWATSPARRTGATTWRVTTQRDGADEEGEDDAGDDEGVAEEVHRRHLLPHRVDEVEVVRTRVGDVDDAADDDGGQASRRRSSPRSSGSAGDPGMPRPPPGAAGSPR